jgi:hypothetical protein
VQGLVPQPRFHVDEVVKPTTITIDSTKHYFDSEFEITTTMHEQAEWWKHFVVARSVHEP